MHHPLTRRQRVVSVTMLLLVSIWLLIFGNQVYIAASQLFDTSAAPAPTEHWLLTALETYGLPLVFGAVLIAAAGLPLPVSLLLLAVGASASQNQQSIAWVIGVALVAAVIGDHLGYLIGWIGGRWLVRRVAGLLKSEDKIPQAQETIRRRGWLAVFFSRWLLLPLGSPLNWVCGSLGYPLRRFFVADVLGEAIYVTLCVFLGVVFSEQIEGLALLIGRTGSWFVGVALAALLVWRLIRRGSDPQTPQLATAPATAPKT